MDTFGHFYLVLRNVYFFFCPSKNSDENISITTWLDNSPKYVFKLIKSYNERK